MAGPTVAYLDAILYAIGLVSAMLIYMPFSPMTIDLLMLPRGAQIWIHRNRHKIWAVVGVCFGVVFLRAITGRAVEQIGPATLTAEIHAAREGADYVRTHDVSALRDALKVSEALNS